MNEDAGYKYLCLLFAAGYYGLNDIIEDQWFKTDLGVALNLMQGLEARTREVFARCGVHSYDEAMALLPILKDDSSEFFGRGPKCVALGFACGIVVLAHCRETLDLRMGWKALEGCTNNANAVMDYFGVASREEFDTVMVRLREEASGFLKPPEVG